MPSASTKSSRGVPIRAANGVVIGLVRGGVFLKRVRAGEHMLVSPPAWACDVVSMCAAVKAGAKSVMVVDTETGDRYEASMDYWRRFGFKIDRGHGLQVALPLERWSKVEHGKPKQAHLFPDEAA